VLTSGKPSLSALNLITCTKSNLVVKVNMDEFVGEFILLKSLLTVCLHHLLLSSVCIHQNGNAL
jgi:hypothetical protein